MKRGLRIALFVIVPLALVGGGAYGVSVKLRKPPPELETALLKHGRLALKVSETGTVEPLTKVEVKSKVSGRIKTMSVEEGDWVNAGQVIAVLEVPELESQSEQIRAQLRGAQQRVAQAQDSYAVTVARNRRELERGQAAVREAEARLAELKAGARTQEVAQAQADVDQAVTRIEDAKRTLARKQELLDRGFIAEQEVDSARTAYDTAQSARESALQRLALLKEGPRPQQVRAAEMQVEQMRSALELAQAEKQRERVQLSAIEEAKAAREQVGRILEEVETKLADAVVVAPRSGQIIQANIRPGELITSGVATFTSGMTICTIGDMSHMLVRVYVNEVDMGKLRLGMPAEIALDAIRGKGFHGRVTRVAPAAFGSGAAAAAPPGQSQVVRFSIEVEFSDATPQVRPGMTATVDMISAERKDTLYAPNDAVRRQRGKTFVQRMASDNSHRVNVTTGLETEGYTELLSGVKAGDRLVLFTPQGLPARKTMEVGGGGGGGGGRAFRGSPH